MPLTWFGINYGCYWVELIISNLTLSLHLRADAPIVAPKKVPQSAVKLEMGLPWRAGGLNRWCDQRAGGLHLSQPSPNLNDVLSTPLHPLLKMVHKTSQT